LRGKRKSDTARPDPIRAPYCYRSWIEDVINKKYYQNLCLKK